MPHDLEEILTLTGEMETFSRRDDALGRLVSRFDEEELGEDDLEFVSAAASYVPYSEFLKRL